MNDTIFVGLDAHKATVAVAVAEGTRGGEVRQMGAIPNRADAIAKLVEKLSKGGNALARRALIEGAWTYRMQARISRKLQDRIETLPQAIRDIAWKTQVRLCARYRRLAAAGKAKVVVTTAIAREMVGFLWAIARQVEMRAAA